MIIYNVTIKVDWFIHNDWLQWMKSVFIPGMMQTGFFVEHRMVKLLGIDESDGPTYAVQYYTYSIESYNQFIEMESPVQFKKQAEKWGDKIVSFSTIMEVVQ